MTKSTVYPKKVKILGKKVYIRNLDSVTEEIDEHGTTIYTYKEMQLSKNEYELQKVEQNNIEVKELTLIDKIKKYRYEKQKWFEYDGHTQRFDSYDVQRMTDMASLLQDNSIQELNWYYPKDNEVIKITDALYLTNMKKQGYLNEQNCREIETELLSDDTVTVDNYKDKFDELLIK